MQATEIEKVVKGVIANKLGINESEITLESNLVNDLGADSLDVVEVSMAMEREFNLNFSEKDTENIATVGDIVNLIVSKQA